MNKHSANVSGAVSTVLNTAHAGARELADHGMPAAARAVATTAAATAAIGTKVHGWAGPVLTAVGPHHALPAHRSRRRRTAAQIRATRKLVAMNRGKHKGKVRRGRKRRTHAQVVATRKLIAYNKKHHRGRKGRRR
jgi:hypothetical protein